MTTVGADISYNILPDLTISGGYYYQYSEKELDEFESYPDGSGFKARLAYDLSDQLQAGVVYTYDENFESRVSADLKVRFGSGAKPKSTPVVITALNETPSNRNVRTANSEEKTGRPLRNRIRRRKERMRRIRTTEPGEFKRRRAF